MTDANLRCPKCDHRMWAEASGTFEFSMLWFCPGCGTAMDRLDALGSLEVELRGDAEPSHVRDLPDDTLWIRGAA